jgi:hypothetical protein
VTPPGSLKICGLELVRVETGVESTPDDSPAVEPAGLDITHASPGCQQYCAKVLAAKCIRALGKGSVSRAECVTTCMQPGKCASAVDVLATCVGERGSVTCPKGDPVVAGCDLEGQAVTACNSF